MKPLLTLPALLSALLVLLLSACSKAPELPVVSEFPLNPEQVATLYGSQTTRQSLFDSGEQRLKLDDRHLNIRLLAPASAGQYPLIVFSHGNWSNQLEYDALLLHWASQGYVVLTVNHLDCCGMARGIVAALRYGNVRLIEQRAWDLAMLLNQPQQLASRLPDGVTADQSRVALTGHSFGAYTAQLFAGATLFDKKIQAQRSVPLQLAAPDAIRAIVAISPPGPMFTEITEHSWDHLQGPVLVTTGTWDVEPRFFPDYRLHLMSHKKAVPGSQYGLVLAGADHYFGRLIGRTNRREPAQQHQFSLLLSVSTAFLDAYVKDEAEALYFLQSNQLTEQTQGFASLSIR
ncbi:hypothetical protein [Alkalimonas sp.]|uniref:alpha/beta hydrolase family protein n=1 Tax=Alkalimonas sp. TaxID=1872453 RepID=UPI00263B8844|nr:hypothetical protein [Alkalimonas sp.]MCC5825042.1 hypothetical protein [Alkalimonas sp.]